MERFGKTPGETGDGSKRAVPFHDGADAGGTDSQARQEPATPEQRRAAAAARARALRAKHERVSGAARQPVRAENEDDDGYDPYSDFHDAGPARPLFERDPWL